jgi:hypothetical protein
MHCSPRSVPVFLKERQSFQPQTGPGAWSGPSSNIRPRESGISHTQALPADLNRFALNRLGLRTASAQRVTAGVAIPIRFFRFFAGETAGVAMPVRFSFVSRRIKPAPAPYDLIIRPRLGDIRVKPHQHVQMIIYSRAVPAPDHGVRGPLPADPAATLRGDGAPRPRLRLDHLNRLADAFISGPWQRSRLRRARSRRLRQHRSGQWSGGARRS